MRIRGAGVRRVRNIEPLHGVRVIREEVYERPAGPCHDLTRPLGLAALQDSAAE